MTKAHDYEAGTIPTISLPQRLRLAREHAGLDQTELAERIGLSRTAIGNAELGKNNPRTITLKAWSLATGVPLSWITTGHAPDSNGPNTPSSHEDGKNGTSAKKSYIRGSFVGKLPRLKSVA